MWVLSTYVITAQTMKLAGKELTETGPCSAVVSAWTVGQKVLGSNPIRVMWDFSALAGSYPVQGVLWAQWDGWNLTSRMHL